MSSLQYDAGMKSLVGVELETGKETLPLSYDGLESIIQANNGGHVEFKVQRIKPGSVCRSKVSSEEESAEGALRRRKGEAGGSIEEVGGGSQEVGKEVKDPIKWFGILVPQNLRRSQQCFVQGI